MEIANFFNNISAAYNLSVIGLVLVSLGSEKNNEKEMSIVGVSAMLGAVLGQLVVGILGDCIGRMKSLIITSLILVLGCLLSAFLPPDFGEKSLDFFTILAICRFIVGFGAGGIYPLTASMSAESAPENSDAIKKEQNLLLVFSGQGWGQLLAPFCVYLSLKFSTSLNMAFRIPLLLGVLPSLIGLALVWRQRRRRERTVEETIEYIAGEFPSEERSKKREEATNKEESFALKDEGLRVKIVKLIGTAGGWFIFDVSFYANLMFSSLILERVFGVKPGDKDFAEKVAGPNTLIVLIGLPGYYAAIFAVKRIGLKRLQMFGFLFLAICYLMLSVLCDVLPPFLLFAVYALTFFFSNCGPNSTTFCLPARVFEIKSRSTLSGFSAASGKMGAIVGTALFPFLVETGGIRLALGISSILSLIGVVLTHMCVNLEKKEEEKVDAEFEMRLMEREREERENPFALAGR